eukprot:7150121-Prymnesium_polylepis.1
MFSEAKRKIFEGAQGRPRAQVTLLFRRRWQRVQCTHRFSQELGDAQQCARPEDAVLELDLGMSDLRVQYGNFEYGETKFPTGMTTLGQVKDKQKIPKCPWGKKVRLNYSALIVPVHKGQPLAQSTYLGLDVLKFTIGLGLA